MKTAKKIFSLLLVAVLMLSAIPFQASAAMDPAYTYVVNFLSGADNATVNQITLTDNMTLNRSQIPTAASVTCKEFSYWKYEKTGVTFNTQIANVYNPDTDFSTLDAYKYINVVAVYRDKHNFAEDTTLPSLAPTCDVPGYKTEKCSSGCNGTREVNIPALGHDFSARIPVSAASCETKGSETIKCSRCSATNGTAEIAALGHDWSDWSIVPGKEPTLSSKGEMSRTCSVCRKVETKDADKVTQDITFTYKPEHGTEGTFTVPFSKNEAKIVKDGKLIPEYRFEGWFCECFNELGTSSDKWVCDHTTFYAKYVEDPNADNMSKITVKARIYKNGVDQKYDRVLLPAEYVVDGERILDYLDSKESEIRAAIDAINPEYKWDGYYYNDDLKTTLTGQEKVNGAKTILIKIDVNPSNLVRVIVYRHDKVSTAAVPAYPVDGFTAGETVLISDVQKAIKDATGRTYSISTMYTDSEWTQLLGGQKITGDTRKIVPDVDTFVLHVVSTSYSGSSTSSKPASNPATGDMIGLAAAAMSLSGAAYVTLTQLRKRNKI